jgi:hypothetical protein
MSAPDLINPLLGALSSPKPWDALEYLPKVEAKEEASRWSTADLDQCVVGLICSQVLIKKLADEDLPADLDGVDRDLLVQCGYSAATTVSRLIAARRLKDSLLQLSLLFPRHFTALGELHADGGTIPAFDGLETIRAHHALWVDQKVFDLLKSSNLDWKQKIIFLQSATVAAATSLSWYYVRIAVERWPASLDGAVGWEVFARICVSVQALMATPNFLATTDQATWKKLSRVSEIVVKTYPTAIRNKLIRGNAPSGTEFVAVIDPVTALSNAGLALISPWLETVSSQSDETAFEEALKRYKGVRGRAHETWTQPTPDRLQRYSDFVSPVEGDGSWPATIPNVEYIVREMIAAGGMEGLMKAPAELIAPTPQGWVWLRTPWMLPLELGGNPSTAQLHRRSPLFAWMVHSSTNLVPSQNVFSNMDIAVDYMQETIGAADKKQRFKQAMLDAESIAFPAAMAASTAGLIPFLFPDTPRFAVAALGAIVYPIVKVVRSRIK